LKPLRDWEIGLDNQIIKILYIIPEKQLCFSKIDPELSMTQNGRVHCTAQWLQGSGNYSW